MSGWILVTTDKYNSLFCEATLDTRYSGPD